jgi:hypothetical protein
MMAERTGCVCDVMDMASFGAVVELDELAELARLEDDKF